jgi:hypothetical protein
MPVHTHQGWDVFYGDVPEGARCTSTKGVGVAALFEAAASILAVRPRRGVSHLGAPYSRIS